MHVTPLVHQAHLRVQVLFFSKLPVKKVKSFFFLLKNTIQRFECREKCVAIFRLIHCFFFFFLALSWTNMRIIHFPLELLRQAESTALPTMKTAPWHLRKAGFIRGKRKTLFFFSPQVLVKSYYRSAPAQTKQTVFSTLWNHHLKAGRHVHVLYVLMDSWREGGGYDIVANWQQSIAIMDVKRPEGQVINSVGLMNERFISSLWDLCLYWAGNKAFEQMKSPPCPPDMSTA